MSVNDIKHRIDAVERALFEVLATPVEGVTLHTATDYGNRINLARKVLRGEVETESMTFSQKWERTSEKGDSKPGEGDRK